jgi:hypothetical protein
MPYLWREGKLMANKAHFLGKIEERGTRFQSILAPQLQDWVV